MRKKLVRTITVEYYFASDPDELKKDVTNQFDDLDQFSDETIVHDELKMRLHRWAENTAYDLIEDTIEITTVP